MLHTLGTSTIIRTTFNNAQNEVHQIVVQILYQAEASGCLIQHHCMDKAPTVPPVMLSAQPADHLTVRGRTRTLRLQMRICLVLLPLLTGNTQIPNDTVSRTFFRYVVVRDEILKSEMPDPMWFLLIA